MREELLREYIKQQLIRERLLRTYVHAILEQQQVAADPIAQATPPPLRSVVEAALTNNSGTYDYVIESAPRTASEIYARFSSSDMRDTSMEPLRLAVEADVKKSYPDATFSLVKLSKHSRKVLRIVTADRQKVTVAFKGASVGGSGIDFETALFAAIKTSPGVSSIEMSSSEKRRLENAFGIDRKLSDKDAIDELSARIKDPEFLEASTAMASLLSRAEASIDSLTAQFGKVSDISLSGGEGGKADLVVTVAGPSGTRDIDISLKHEKGSEGSNLFIFNKDLGDGTQSRALGRDAGKIKRFNANLIEAPGGKAWWQVARQGIVEALKEKLGKDWPLTTQEETEFVSSPDSSAMTKIRSLFIEDKKQRGAASKVPAATLRDAAVVFVDSLKALQPEQVLSLIEESQFGAASINPLYKLTSSGGGSKLKQINQSSAMQKVNAGTLKATDIGVEVDRIGKTSNIEIKLVDKTSNEDLASLVIRGLKFRGSVFSASPGDLKIKTRA